MNASIAAGVVFPFRGSFSVRIAKTGVSLLVVDILLSSGQIQTGFGAWAPGDLLAKNTDDPKAVVDNALQEMLKLAIHSKFLSTRFLSVGTL